MMSDGDRKLLERFSEMYDRAEIYYAYDIIYTNVLSPFKTTHPMTLFNCSRFLLMRLLNREPPLGVSMVNVVYTLARHAMDLGAFKLARFAFNKLQVCAAPRHMLTCQLLAGPGSAVVVAITVRHMCSCIERQGVNTCYMMLLCSTFTSNYV